MIPIRTELDIQNHDPNVRVVYNEETGAYDVYYTLPNPITWISITVYLQVSSFREPDDTDEARS